MIVKRLKFLAWNMGSFFQRRTHKDKMVYFCGITVEEILEEEFHKTDFKNHEEFLNDLKDAYDAFKKWKFTKDQSLKTIYGDFVIKMAIKWKDDLDL